MLEVEGLRYRHKDTVAMEYQYDLKVDAGEIACLTGKSGSGKSTCLDLIAGFLTPDAGRVRIAGKDILDIAPESRPLTIMFQSNNLFEHLTAAQNVALGTSTSLRLTDDETRQVESALDRVGLLPLARRRASKLSGGERQRVALARCLIRKRPVLLLDEPFGALDVETRRGMISLLREITTERSVAVLMVTHDPDECREVADRHYRLRDGRTLKLRGK